MTNEERLKTMPRGIKPGRIVHSIYKDGLLIKILVAYKLVDTEDKYHFFSSFTWHEGYGWVDSSYDTNWLLVDYVLNRINPHE